MTYFVADALRAMDYLETRNDVDSSLGFTMTGVSGGCLTTIFCSLLDERIAFSAPVCCLSEHENIHFKDLYTSCPEQFGPGFIEVINNLNEIKRIVNERTMIMAVVKADAYGHGACRIAEVLARQGVDRLAVATLDEAIQLRKFGITIPIQILSYTFPDREKNYKL
jgi:hypothetical protein